MAELRQKRLATDATRVPRPAPRPVMPGERAALIDISKAPSMMEEAAKRWAATA